MRREAVITIVIILVILIGEWQTQSYSRETLGGVQDSLRRMANPKLFKRNIRWSTRFIKRIKRTDT